MKIPDNTNKQTEHSLQSDPEKGNNQIQTQSTTPKPVKAVIPSMPEAIEKGLVEVVVPDKVSASDEVIASGKQIQKRAGFDKNSKSSENHSHSFSYKSLLHLPIIIQIAFIAAITFAFFFIFRVIQETAYYAEQAGDYKSVYDVWSLGKFFLLILGLIFSYVFIRIIWNLVTTPRPSKLGTRLLWVQPQQIVIPI
jgi:hypothetical protein